MSAWRSFLGVLALLSSSTAAAETWVDVTTSAFDHVVGAIQHWDADRIVIAGQPQTTIAVAEIVSIRFPRQPQRTALGASVILTNGDRFAAEAVRVRDEQVTATWVCAPLRPELSVPLEAVSAIVCAAPPGRVDALQLLAQLQRRPAGTDTVRLMAGDQLTGEFQQLEGGLLQIQAAVGPLKLDRRRVQWLALDPELAADLPSPPDRWLAYLIDGSRLTALTCVPRPDFTIQLSPLVGKPVIVPWHEIVRLQHITPRQELLSDRPPLEETYQPYLGGTVARERDRSAAGSPLQMRGEEFAHGLGWRSRSAVTYAIEPEHRWFHSSVGIDDAAGGQGSARFRVELDGREVWASGEVTGRAERRETPRIDVRGHRRISLLVEFGERGDVGDLADWCDPMLTRDP